MKRFKPAATKKPDGNDNHMPKEKKKKGKKGSTPFHKALGK